MSISSRVIFHLPTHPGHIIDLPYLPSPAPVGGRRLPNGTIVLAPENAPALFYKFSHWSRSALAFNEADIHARLRDFEEIPGIVRLLGISGTQEHFVRILERSSHGPLDRFLLAQTGGEPGTVEPGFARRMLAQIARGLAALHACDLVHRDIKAENILVFDADGPEERGMPAVKISDFDRAVMLSSGSTLEEPVGSLFHMAPELLAWRPYDRKIDVYAFGITMFEVLHGGSRPYTNVATAMPGSISRSEFADKVLHEGLRPDWRHDDEALKHLAALCWAAEPQDRPDFHDIADMLSAAGAPSLASGRKRSDPDSRRFGIASTIGKVRAAMEDAACVLQTPDSFLACVFDGLRGHRTSAASARQLALILAHELQTSPDEAPDLAIHRAFAAVNAYLREIEPPLRCGSTVTLALVQRDRLAIAWLGDSPAYLIRRQGPDADISIEALVEEHRPSRDDEAARIVASGGTIAREQRLLDNGEAVPWGPLRVFAPRTPGGDEPDSGVALSRALGLLSFKPAVGEDPETKSRLRQDEDLFLIVATDGVFDVLDGAAVGRIVSTALSPQKAAQAIIDAVLERGAPDNASAIVIDIKPA